MRGRGAGYRPRTLRSYGFRSSNCEWHAGCRETAATRETSKSGAPIWACGQRLPQGAFRAARAAHALHHSLELQSLSWSSKGSVANARIINDPAVGRRQIDMAELDQAFTGVVLAMEPSSEFKKRVGRRPRALPVLLKHLRGSKPAVTLLVVLVSLALVVPGIVIPTFSKIFRRRHSDSKCQRVAHPASDRDGGSQPSRAPSSRLCSNHCCCASRPSSP